MAFHHPALLLNPTPTSWCLLMAFRLSYWRGEPLPEDFPENLYKKKVDLPLLRPWWYHGLIRNIRRNRKSNKKNVSYRRWYADPSLHSHTVMLSELISLDGTIANSRKK
jgi:hypothetical protein